MVKRSNNILYALDVTSIQAQVLLLTLQILSQFESFSRYEDMEQSLSLEGCIYTHFLFILYWSLFMVIIANFILNCSRWGHIGLSMLVQTDSSRVERIHSC